MAWGDWNKFRWKTSISEKGGGGIKTQKYGRHFLKREKNFSIDFDYQHSVFQTIIDN